MRRNVKDRQSERGQTLGIVVVSLVVLLGCAALVIDVGLSMWAKRQLQAQVDAAALAGAQNLPTASAAEAAAQEYLTRNPLTGVNNVTADINTECIPTLAGCDPVNAVEVEATAHVDTKFARVFGLDDIEVNATGKACHPCGSKPVDLVVVLDRTGSMVQNGSTKLALAKQGIRTLLSTLDPEYSKVGLVVTPPVKSGQSKCATADDTWYDATSASYLVEGLQGNFADADGVINESSPLVQTLTCQPGGGATAYAVALEKAQAELVAHGRADSMRVIVFLTDGAANLGPHYFSSTSTYRTKPCRQGVTSANTIKGTGTEIYTIGYAIGGDKCQKDRQNGDESPFITPASALSQMATDSAHYFTRPDAGQLNTIFKQVGLKVTRGSRLIG